MKNRYLTIILAAFLVALIPACTSSNKIKTLIITGQSDHMWMTSSEALKTILNEAGLFSASVLLTPDAGEEMSGFNPDFSKYKLVVIDYKGTPWPEKTNAALMDFVNNGGGVVLFNSTSDPLSQPPDSLSVSERDNIEVRTLLTDHPVTKGLPLRWLHPQDILVSGLKFAGEDVQVLATATGAAMVRGRRPVSVPVLAARSYGKGRIFLTMMGTPDDMEDQALHCAGFIVTLQRGAEWAATGSVTQEVPFDFPTAAGTMLRPGFKEIDFKTAFGNIGSYDITQSTKYFTWLDNEIRKASGDPAALLRLEKKMVEVLNNSAATIDAKKLILKELSWMGTDYCIPAIKGLSAVPELRDEVDFALERLDVAK